MSRLLSSLLCLVLIVPSALAADATTINGNVGPLHFSYPSDWGWTDIVVGNQAVVKAPLEDWQAKTDLLARIWVKVERASSPTLQKVDSLFLADKEIGETGTLIDWYVPSFTLTDKSDASLLGLPARRFEYNAEWGSIPVRAVTIMTATDKELISITMFTRPANFETYLPVFDKVKASLSYVNPASAIKRGNAAKIPAKNPMLSPASSSSSRSSATSSSSVSARAKRPLKKIIRKPVRKARAASSASRSK